jgi:transcriptional regulator with XRE-family HTH domain
MPVKLAEHPARAGIPPYALWSRHLAADTVIDVGEDAERLAFRRRLGANLARIRKDLTDLSQEVVADRLGIDVETYGRIERGTREPRAFDLARIADILGVPAEWLLDPTDSFSELDRRIAMLRRAAVEAARADEGEGQDPPAGAGGDAPPGKR